jgi:hypothetical protein
MKNKRSTKRGSVAPFSAIWQRVHFRSFAFNAHLRKKKAENRQSVAHSNVSRPTTRDIDRSGAEEWRKMPDKRLPLCSLHPVNR